MDVRSAGKRTAVAVTTAVSVVSLAVGGIVSGFLFAGTTTQSSGTTSGTGGTTSGSSGTTSGSSGSDDSGSGSGTESGTGSDSGSGTSSGNGFSSGGSGIQQNQGGGFSGRSSGS